MVSFKQFATVGLVFYTNATLQQEDNSSSDNSCSFISGEGCLNGVCKYCAMCLPSVCILATPYSTGDNDGSTCAVTDQPYGYDFYNYCLSSGLANDDDDDNDDGDGDGGVDDDGNGDNYEDDCNTSTACYSYRQGDLMQHVWDDLTCNDFCQLILKNGSLPPISVPIKNTTMPTTTQHHPLPGVLSSGNVNPHRNQLDSKPKSPTSIALISVCTVISFLLIIWLVRLVFFKTKYWPWISKYFCCGFCKQPIVPLSPSSLSQHIAESTPNTRPPSFQSNISRHSNIPYSAMRQNSINHSIHSNSNSSNGSLPSYHCQDPSLPKYEQAIVTQIRGMSFFDHHSSSSSTQQQPIWIPIYLSSSSVNNSTIVSSPIFNSFLSSNSDWARPTDIRHQPLMRSQTSLTIHEISDQQYEEEAEERRARV